MVANFETTNTMSNMALTTRKWMGLALLKKLEIISYGVLRSGALRRRKAIRHQIIELFKEKKRNFVG